MHLHTTPTSLIERLIFWAGPAGIIGGIAVALAYLLHPAAAPPEMVASDFWITIHALFFLSLVSGIYLLIMLSVMYLRKGGLLIGVLGAALGIVSMILIAALDYAEMFIFPVLAVEFPEVVHKYGDGVAMPSLSFVFPLTGVLFLAGFATYSWELRVTRAVNPKIALALMISVIVFVAGLSGLFPMFVVKTGAVLFGLSLAGIGLDVVQQQKKAYAGQSNFNTVH